MKKKGLSFCLLQARGDSGMARSADEVVACAFTVAGSYEQFVGVRGALVGG